MRTTVRLTAACAALALASTLVGCGGSDEGEADSGPEATTTAPASGDGETETTPVPAGEPGAVAALGTYRVGRIDRTLVDDTRTTNAHGDQAEQPDRTLPALVLYPVDGAPAEAGAVELAPDTPPAPGPRPLIVFGHGSTRAGDDYLATLAAWASAGYVVAAPNFPLSTTGAPGGTDYGDVGNQTGDVSFVIDQVLAASADPDDLLHDTVDPESIGVGGQSFGAITALAVGFNACCADPRIDAVTSFAGTWADLGEGTTVADVATARPGLLIHGDADEVLSHQLGQQALDAAPDAARMLTLVGGSHDDGYFGGMGDPLDRLVTEATTAFYDRWLKGDEAAEDRLEALVAEAGPEVATLS